MGNFRSSTASSQSSQPGGWSQASSSPGPYASATRGGAVGVNAPLGRKFSRRYSHISDQFTTLEQVQQALSQAGLESSNLIVGIDFTKSNEWTGKHSFSGRSLHAVGATPNPYEQAIAIIGKTLSAFDDDNLIPCFGFGDASTHDHYVFSFMPDHRPCEGFEEALSRYRAIVPHLRLAGPTSFAPIIEAASAIVEETGGQYHVLLIIADGQVTRSVDTDDGGLSPQEQATIDAIVAASEHPLSIVVVGVGDGPWDMMREFDDNIPSRGFDNFQFVNFSQIMGKNMANAQKEALFALCALMEIPAQYKATIELNILGRRRGRVKAHPPLPPPQAVQQADALASSFPQSASIPRYPDLSDYYANSQRAEYFSNSPLRTPQSATASPNRVSDALLCPVCLTERKDMAFGCGHQTCRECGQGLETCPICRQTISTRIRLY